MDTVSLVTIARPHHWVKNVVVLLPLVFGQQMYRADAWAAALAAAAAFCLASSGAYVINDIKDRVSDRAHPVKRNRPLPSGQMGTRAALIEAILFSAGAVILAQRVSVALMGTVVVFLLLQLMYSLFLKHVALIDVICIALGFVLRAAAGAIAIKVLISPWLFICMFTICLFMGFCKRYGEIVMVGDASDAEEHRPILVEYNPELLTHLITLSAAIAVVSFLFYGLSETTVAQFGTNYIVYTLPVTVYAVFRFAMISMKGLYEGPADLIWRDRPFQAAVCVWAIMVLVIIRYGRDLSAWIHSVFY
ncbi:MAG TPA: decaprenyl-phosphate phosphoribosyltransferase [Planctomycetes bacterium]|nr:decaprenyl-phosphate phosphoribosyltransferase [Planctomycetota bacterium]